MPSLDELHSRGSFAGPLVGFVHPQYEHHVCVPSTRDLPLKKQHFSHILGEHGLYVCKILTSPGLGVLRGKEIAFLMPLTSHIAIGESAWAVSGGWEDLT